MDNIKYKHFSSFNTLAVIVFSHKRLNAYCFKRRQKEDLIKVLSLQFVFLVLFLSHNYELLKAIESPIEKLWALSDQRIIVWQIICHLGWNENHTFNPRLFSPSDLAQKKAMSGISSEFLHEKLQKEFNPIHLVGEINILYSVCALYAHNSA